MKEGEKEKENRLSKEEEEELRRLEEKYRVLNYKVAPIVGYVMIFWIFLGMCLYVGFWLFLFLRHGIFETLEMAKTILPISIAVAFIWFIIFSVVIFSLSIYSTLIQMRLSELYSKRGDFAGLVGGTPFFLRRKKKEEKK